MRNLTEVKDKKDEEKSESVVPLFLYYWSHQRPEADWKQYLIIKGKEERHEDEKTKEEDITEQTNIKEEKKESSQMTACVLRKRFVILL